MGVRIVLQNAKAQLEAQKQKVYQDAYNERYDELKPQIDAYTLEKKQEYDEAVVMLRGAYEEAVTAKKVECESLASGYAQMKMAVVDNSIAELNKMIEKAED